MSMKNTVSVDNGMQVKTYSPMSVFDRFIYLLLVSVSLFSIVRYVIWWLKPSHIPSNWFVENHPYFHYFDYILFVAVSFVIFFGLFLKIGTWFAMWFIKRPYHIPAPPGLRVAFLTCYVPGKEPIEMLCKTLTAMKEVEYPHDTWVLDEGNDVLVKELCHELGVHHFTRKNKAHYNQPIGHFRKKTKAGNLNSWRHEHESNYDIVAQLDMDHVPKKNYLIRVLGFFSDKSVGFVGLPQIYKNTGNWIAKGSSEQTHFFYGPLQQGFYGAHMPFFIGTTHIYRVKAMQGFGGYAPTIAEDYLTGMHFLSSGWKGVYLPEVLAEGDGPESWVDYFNQQMRWSYGLYEILFQHTYKHFFKIKLLQKVNLFFSQLFYFSGVAAMVGFVLTFLYLVFGFFPANINFTEWISYALPSYMGAFAISLFVHKYYINPSKDPKIGFYGGILAQAANVIYSIAFLKYITRQNLTYKVTPKGSHANFFVDLSAFFPYISLLILLVIALEISFIQNHDSWIMRYWAISLIGVLSVIIITGYWRRIASFVNLVLLKKLIHHTNNSIPVPKSTGMLDYDKYGYVISNPWKVRILYLVGIICWSLSIYGFFQFLSINKIYILFFGPILFLISFHNFLNYGINLFYRKFDVKKHELLRKQYWEEIGLHKPLVDIFLPVCGEPEEILRLTFQAVQNMDYYAKKTYVLDDKGDSSVEKLAKEFDFEYLSRPNKGEMKKAGNLLYGFRHGKGEFYAVFDADFCPNPDFINDLLPYMKDEKIGLVQSPHYFEISDNIHKRSPIEFGSANLQEQFFRTIQVSRDTLGGAICAGSNTIYRRSAIERNGGPAQVDHGEDVNTGIDLINLGYKIKYIPIILAKGLSPDTLPAFYKQQNRWASSSTGLLLSGRIFKSRLTIVQKLCYLSGISYYLSQLGYFLLPFQLFLMLGFHADSLTYSRALPFYPYMVYSLVVLPLFSRKTKPKYGTYLAIITSAYVHCYTVILRLLGRPATWVPTNTISSSLERGFNILHNVSLFYLSLYILMVTFLLYRWHLPVFNGLFFTIVFWMAWNVRMHYIFFRESFRIVHIHKVQSVMKAKLRRRHVHAWRLRTAGLLGFAVLTLVGVFVYTTQITNYQSLFMERTKLLDHMATQRKVDSEYKKNIQHFRTAYSDIKTTENNEYIQQLAKSWVFYKDNFITENGQSVDPDRQYKTTSEGQSYILLRAVMMDDRDTFDISWDWIQQNLQHSQDSLMAWLWGKRGSTEQIIDKNNATDADEDIALALILASYKWNENEYLNEAQLILNDIWDENVEEIQGKYYLLAGSQFSKKDGIVINPSYLSPASYKIFAHIDGSHDWNALAENSYDLLFNIYVLDTSNVGLPPNWIFVDRQGDVSSAEDYITDDYDVYGYAAFRTYWRIALDSIWNNSKLAQQYLEISVPFFKKEWINSKKFNAVYSVSGLPVVSHSSVSTNTGPLMIFDSTEDFLSVDIFQKLFLNQLSENGEYWGDGTNYYDQNWGWFGTALYTRNFDLPKKLADELKTDLQGKINN